MNDVPAASSRLEEALAARFGGRLAGVERRQSPYQSSFLLDEVDARLTDGTMVPLVAKAVDARGLSSSGRLAKPTFLENADRERAVYEAILAPSGISAPACYGTFDDAAGIRYLLLERIDGAPLWQFGELEAWRAAARWLARFHVPLGVHSINRSAAWRHLIRYDRRYYDGWLYRARAVCGSGLPVAVASAYVRVTDRLLGQPMVFIHGEFYPSNVLVRREDDFAVRPVDWEMAALGPAVMDLACLLAGRWADDCREDLALAYYDAASACAARHRSPLRQDLAETEGGDGTADGVWLPDRREFLMTLDCCLLHLSIRNLGWSRHWSPPPDRDHDWLGDAVRLCDKWNL